MGAREAAGISFVLCTGAGSVGGESRDGGRASAQDWIDDVGILEETGGVGAGAVARLAAEFTAARHPETQPLRLDATFVDQIAGWARRERQRRVFEMRRDAGFAGIEENQALFHFRISPLSSAHCFGTPFLCALQVAGIRSASVHVSLSS